jgi:hypothetical protein
MIYLKASEFLCFEGEEDLIIFVDKKFVDIVKKSEKKISLHNKKMTLYFNEEMENHLLNMKNIRKYENVYLQIEDKQNSEALKLKLHIND